MCVTSIVYNLFYNFLYFFIIYLKSCQDILKKKHVYAPTTLKLKAWLILGSVETWHS